MLQSDDVAIFARVAIGWRPGARMAAILGMVMTGREGLDEIWEMRR
jgi:hypothetical protein